VGVAVATTCVVFAVAFGYVSDADFDIVDRLLPEGGGDEGRSTPVGDIGLDLFASLTPFATIYCIRH